LAMNDTILDTQGIWLTGIAWSISHFSETKFRIVTSSNLEETIVDISQIVRSTNRIIFLGTIFWAGWKKRWFKFRPIFGPNKQSKLSKACKVKLYVKINTIDLCSMSSNLKISLFFLHNDPKIFQFYLEI